MGAPWVVVCGQIHDTALEWMMWSAEIFSAAFLEKTFFPFFLEKKRNQNKGTAFAQQNVSVKEKRHFHETLARLPHCCSARGLHGAFK